MSKRLLVLDLFSGIGGFSLGLERAGMQTVAFCEIDPYCRAVLKKHWPSIPIFEDVRTLTASQVGAVDVICGGFPCQPYSVAGKRLGNSDSRALWPEYFRLIRELRPAWVLGENTIGLASAGLDGIAADLEGKGYQVRTFDIPACAVGAAHERRRLWIVAYLDGQGLQERFMQPGISRKAGCDANGENITLDTWWKARSNVVRGLHGIPGRVDRVRALGNSVVPQIPEIIGRAIIAAHTFPKPAP